MASTKKTSANKTALIKTQVLLKQFLGLVGSLLLCLIVLLTCIDVVGRYFFSAPLVGAHELITIAMGLMIYFAMPLVTASREHLTVDLLSNFLGPRVKHIHQIFINILGALTFCLFSFLLITHGLGLAEDLMATQDFEIEQAPIAFLMAASCCLTIIVFCRHVLKDLKSRTSNHRHSKLQSAQADNQEI